MLVVVGRLIGGFANLASENITALVLGGVATAPIAGYSLCGALGGPARVLDQLLHVQLAEGLVLGPAAVRVAALRILVREPHLVFLEHLIYLLLALDAEL